MSSISNHDHPLRLFVFDSARTNFQAFFKLFSQHPQLRWGRFYHGFASAAWYGPERIQLRLRHGDAAEKSCIEWGTQFPSANSQTYNMVNEDLAEKIKETEKDGKTFIGKEHIEVKSNPTCIPDQILESFTPIFVIRRPILMVDSLYRCQLPVMGQLPTDEDFDVMGTFRFTRILFDYFKSKGSTPALVEAVDFIYNNKPTMDKLCSKIGIDPEGIKDTWDPIPEEYFPYHHVAVAFTGDMMRSSGIERRNKEPAEWTINIDEQTEKWKKLYGDEIATGLRHRVEVEMPIYEYLRSFKISP